ncbi:MAG: hypothetical protein EPN60_11305 [Nevskiaceae bacterium]|jgi:hypothetical protein|nr:MAG: hypothetical protein EPO48_04520 [Nevskiaceae bacterium]TAM25940.1 MAG: hypothetical protein EPN60_11305 [Nevskiaceae bacterium]
MHRSLPCLALLLTVGAAQAGVADPFSTIPAIPAPDAQGTVDCSNFEAPISALYNAVDAREQKLNDERDRLEPLVQAEQQAQVAAAMQGGAAFDAQALAAQYQGYSDSAAGMLETDAECIAWSHDGGLSQNFGVSKGMAPTVRGARMALHEQLKAAPAGDYQTAFQKAAPDYVSQLNGAIATGRSRNAQCANAWESRVKQSNAKLKGNLQKLMQVQSDGELYRLKRALALAQDGQTLCNDVGYRLNDYAGGIQAVRGYTAAGGKATATGTVQDTTKALVDQVKDNAVGKALDKAFSIFGK